MVKRSTFNFTDIKSRDNDDNGDDVNDGNDDDDDDYI